MRRPRSSSRFSVLSFRLDIFREIGLVSQCRFGSGLLRGLVKGTRARDRMPSPRIALYREPRTWGARAWQTGAMTGDRRGSRLLLLALFVAGPAAAVDAACVRDLVEDARQRLESDVDFPGQATRRGELDDVDGDGEPEALVSFREHCGVRNCTWAIYRTGRGCAKYAGTLEGAAWRVLETSHHGLRDLTATWVAGCVGAQRYETVLEFDGGRYRPTSVVWVDECGGAGPAESPPQALGTGTDPGHDAPPRPDSPSPWRGERISLSLKDADLREVLRSFAQLGGFDLVLHQEVRGSVTLELHDVPWDQALSVILRTHGLAAELSDGRLWAGPAPPRR